MTISRHIPLTPQRQGLRAGRQRTILYHLIVYYTILHFIMLHCTIMHIL